MAELAANSTRRYWRFWWPLALVGLAMPLARVIQNGALARFPDGTTELALFAFAQGTFFIPRSAMVFMPQMANVLARSRADHERCRRFAISIGVALAVPIVALATIGSSLLGTLYQLSDAHIDAVATYLLWLSPLLLLDGVTSYTNGLLVRHERTGAVSLGTLSNLAVVTIGSILGLQLGWSPVATIVGTQLAAAAVNTTWVLLAWRRTEAVFEPATNDDSAITAARIVAFFLPLAITSMMFAASRPTIYAIVGGTEQALLTIAVLRVAFDLGMLFQLPVNQFRHLMVTFAAKDRDGVVRFMRQIAIIITVVMAAVVLSPIGDALLGPLLGAEPSLRPLIREAWVVLLLVPAVVTWRNVHHGLAMVRRKTAVMAFAGIARVGLIALICLGARALGWLDHRVGAAAMVAGFAIEAVLVWCQSRRQSDLA